MNKYTIGDLEKGIDFLKKKCQAVFVIIDIDELGRLLLKGSDITGNMITVVVFDESTQKMPEVTRTERL